MSALSRRKRDFRYGAVLQGFAAPSLFGPMAALPPSDRKEFDESKRRQTTPSPAGRFTGDSIIRFRKAMERGKGA